MAGSNTSRSKKFLEKQGWSVAIVEQNINIPAKFPGAKPMIFKRDMFNCFDLVCINGEAIAGVQTTTTANQSSRIAKIMAIPEAEMWLLSKGLIYVHGWKKSRKTNRWQVTVTAIEKDQHFKGLRAREITLEDSPLFANIEDESEDENADVGTETADTF